MPLGKIKTKWESEKPNPDEQHLKKQFDAEVAALNNAFSKDQGHSQRLHGNRERLIKASGLNDSDLHKLAKEAERRAKDDMDAAEKELAKPAIDIEALHKQDLELAKKNAEQVGVAGNPSWSGYVFSPNYGGWWSSWNGESEEVPSSAWSTTTERIDPRAQAYGEGWFDGDYSEIHAYLAFAFRPPSWGHLHVYAYPWFHGYYQLYSNDDWYNSEYARAELDSWIDLHQNFWRPRDYDRRFTLGGEELHPTRYGRIDTRYTHSYYTSIGATDQVTIRVGARLYDYARAGGSLSRLNFQSGDANYICIPYVYWYLHH